MAAGAFTGATALGATEAFEGAFIRKLSFINEYSICSLGFTAILYPASHCVVVVRASNKNAVGHLSACSRYLVFKDSGNSSKLSIPPFLATMRSLKCELKAATK